VPDAVWRVAAVVVAVAHLALVLFVVGGGFAARRRRPLRYAHLAVVAAVVAVALARAPCPLTELELRLRELGGAPAYRGGFVGHYLVRPVHAPGLTPPVAVLVNGIAVVANLVAYRRRSQPAGVPGDPDGVDAVAGTRLGDGVRQVVAHRRR
jgi:hypothetical protein